jgi:hypothetical protein
MTCNHVIGLIDAGPFVDYSHDHGEAARVHARQCPTCGPALTASEAVTTSLRMLPHPALPRDFTADVLARAAAVEQARREVRATVSVPVASRSPWVPASATVLAAAAIAVSLASADVPLFRVAPFSGGGLGLPSTGAGMFLLLAGLALYAFGLLVPLRSHPRRLPASMTLRSSDH